ncbi:hypothetical protein G7Y89_g7327 [Cudoniella acicularis]|uniref:Uncharacterized protein n=1 Tax=Cudoniella acicularis TaxID=354080 RepID=A0A8H4W229_9HELO|nr:hypothetical protein G7Y89_g7327 [Cudoniella acicularis]
MPSLVIPESGVSLRSSHETSAKHGAAPPEVLGLTLTDNVIEEMIKCVQNGKPIQLSLGEHSSLSYGTKTQHLSTSIDPFTHELYRSTISDSDSDSEDMAFLNRDHKRVPVGTRFESIFSRKSFKPGPKPPAASKAKPASSVPSSSADSALEQLQSSLAAESLRKKENTTKLVPGLPAPARRGGAGSKIPESRDLNETTGKWELRKPYYKELDVWSYNYSCDEDRQRAIDNSVKQYDKMRLGVSEPEWDRLLPKSERGTGKCLSKLQAQIAQGPVGRTSKGKGQKDDGSGRDTSPGEEEDLGNKNLSKLKGEAMLRSTSQPPITKTKKVSEKEAQAKRLLSKNPSKAAAKPAAKAAPAKKEKPAKAGPKVLSTEFVEDSDDEEDLPISKPPPKPIAAKKRARDIEEETSDSSGPLSKKVKKDQPPHRISDASQSSRTTNTSAHSSSSTKTKDTSPQKSSPLASSPPTNASEFENSSGNRTVSSSSASPAPHLNGKGSRSPIQKRHHKSSSVTSSVSSNGSTRYLKPEVVDLARKYRSYYPKYEALHRELANMTSRNSEKEAKLLEMHERLAMMKRDINAGIVEIS